MVKIYNNPIEVQNQINDERGKAELIDKLLRKDEVKPAKKSAVQRKKEEPDKVRPPLNEGIDNPENELEFKKAYLKLTEKLAEDKESSKVFVSDKDVQKVNNERKVNMRYFNIIEN